MADIRTYLANGGCARSYVLNSINVAAASTSFVRAHTIRQTPY